MEMLVVLKVEKWTLTIKDPLVTRGGGEGKGKVLVWEWQVSDIEYEQGPRGLLYNMEPIVNNTVLYCKILLNRWTLC